MDNEVVKQKIPIQFEKINSYDIEDSRYTKVKVKVLHTGLNLNNSIFTKEVVTNAIPSIFNCPILAYVVCKEDGTKDYSDHREVLVIEKNDIKIVYKGMPYGVIPESSKVEWNTYKCSDGIEREYLEIEGLIWNKLEDSEILLKDGIKSQSMELQISSIEGEYNEENHYVFTSFKFDGFTMLGDDVCPAMIDSTVSTNFSYNIDEIKTKLEQYNTYFSKQSQTPNGDDINKNEMKGGNILTTEIINGLFAEFSLSRDEVEFEITDETTEENLRTFLTSFSTEKQRDVMIDGVLAEFSVTREEIGEFADDIIESDFRTLVSEFAKTKNQPSNPEPEDNSKANFSTYNQKRELLRGALPETREYEGEGDERHLKYVLGYYPVDFDDNYVYVEKEEYNGNNWSYSKGRFAYSITDNVASITSDFEVMIVKWVTPEEDTEIEKARSNFEAQTVEFERLKQFEVDTLKANFETKANTIFTQFDEQLANITEYDVLKADFSDMKLDAIEEKCYALLGKKNANFSVPNITPPVINFGLDRENDEPEDDGYGGLLSKKYNN